MMGMATLYDREAKQGIEVAESLSKTHSFASEPELSAGSKIIDSLSQACSRIQMLQRDIEQKLSPVCRGMVTDESDGPKVQEETFPPYFAELRDYIRGINSAIDSIEENIERVEL